MHHISSALPAIVLAWVYALSACFFTSAALLQLVGSRAVAAVAALIQFAGTIFFNVNTIRGVREITGAITDPLVVWRPEAYGSVCFLVSIVVAFAAINRRAPASGDCQAAVLTCVAPYGISSGRCSLASRRLLASSYPMTRSRSTRRG